jgi:hypothetical protein
VIDGELVALFTEWTSKGEMRHLVFLGLRTDKGDRRNPGNR